MRTEGHELELLSEISDFDLVRHLLATKEESFGSWRGYRLKTNA